MPVIHHLSNHANLLWNPHQVGGAMPGRWHRPRIRRNSGPVDAPARVTMAWIAAKTRAAGRTFQSIDNSNVKPAKAMRLAPGGFRSDSSVPPGQRR